MNAYLTVHDGVWCCLVQMIRWMCIRHDVTSVSRATVNLKRSFTLSWRSFRERV